MTLVRQSRQNGDFGVAKLPFRGHFVVALRSFWAHFGVSWISVGDLRSLDGYFAMIVQSLWVYEGLFSKTIHFPHRF